MAAITSSNVANAIVKLVAADALPVLVSNLVMGNLVNRDYEPVLAHAGDTVNVPIPPTMVGAVAISILTDPGTPTPACSGVQSATCSSSRAIRPLPVWRQLLRCLIHSESLPRNRRRYPRFP